MDAPPFNTVAWFQVGTEEPEPTKRFYSGLFGWTYAHDPGDGETYEVVKYAGAETPSGGIAQIDEPSQRHAIFMVIVEDVAATVTRTEQLGGKVLVPPITTPNGLVFAHLLDPSGNQFGVFSPPAAG